MALEFVRHFFRIRHGDGAPLALSLFTPNVIGPDRPALRVVVGGVTVLGLMAAGAVALSSLLTLLGALFGIYLLLTQVLGLQLDLDPRAFVEEAQRYAASARN